ncbi:MAG TPA: hypothetical protein IGS17_15230 [Oscillatoriales cyanobacterium M59_W2019_021]|nr:MAG: hypothetical protein D6728_01485 [Cyanobacteria bacterium J055]HIK30125.1 hypothetical protein [Oscillatoriales cyanobacterium M4454_W2019_049]HIK52259.1 hypothetical protein [Oscillatoriales cyanobacterium M59_W2019_021]
MKPTEDCKPNSTADNPLFVELSAEESNQIRGAYYGYYNPVATPYYEPSFYYRPNPYPQYHYTYYNVANPAYLLS